MSRAEKAPHLQKSRSISTVVSMQFIRESENLKAWDDPVSRVLVPGHATWMQCALEYVHVIKWTNKVKGQVTMMVTFTFKHSLMSPAKQHQYWPDTFTSSLQTSSYTLLQQFHWLPTEYHINFKIANISLSAPYIFSLAWSSHHSFYQVVKYQSVPFVCISFGARSFKHCSSWNLELSSASSSSNVYCSPDTFHRRLKTHCFQQALQFASRASDSPSVDHCARL